MSTATAKAPIKRRSKGEQTRNQILNAAIEVLASQGIKGTTHRAIATHADIQLSLTTYYFKDIQELVHEAFMLSSTKTVSKAGAAWIQAFKLLDAYPKAQLKKTAIKTELATLLCEMATQYLVNKIITSPIELTIEQLLFTEIQVTPQLRELAHHHRNALLAPFVKLCSYFNKSTAETDADIMLTLFTQLEYRNLMNPSNQIDIKTIEQTVKRIIHWIMQIK